MLHFSKGDSEADLTTTTSRIKELSSKIEQKLAQKDKGIDDFVETLSVEELKDLRQIMLASEYLLTKYQDKKDLKIFLQDFIGVIMNAANSVNGMQGELEDLLISAEVALQQIQNLHHEMTCNLELGKVVQTRIDDFKVTDMSALSKREAIPTPIPEESGSINFTNTSRPVNTRDYLERTAVEI